MGFGRSSDGFNGHTGTTQQPIIYWEQGVPDCVIPAGTQYRLRREPPASFPSQTAAASSGRTEIAVPITPDEQRAERIRQTASYMPSGGGDSFRVTDLPEVITDESVRLTMESRSRRTLTAIPSLPVCETGTAAQASYEELFEPLEPNYSMALPHSSVGLFKQTIGNWRVQLLATAVGPRTSRSTISTYRVDAIFALVTGNGTVIIGSDVYPEYLASSMRGTSGSRSTTTNMLVSANELANTTFVLLAERTCNWGVSLSTLDWIDNCHNYWGETMTRPPRGALSTRLVAEQFIAIHLAEMQSSTTVPGGIFDLAGWRVMRIR